MGHSTPKFTKAQYKGREYRVEARDGAAHSRLRGNRGVRIRHMETGVEATGYDYRCLSLNLPAALEKAHQRVERAMWARAHPAPTIPPPPRREVDSDGARIQKYRARKTKEVAE